MSGGKDIRKQRMLHERGLRAWGRGDLLQSNQHTYRASTVCP